MLAEILTTGTAASTAGIADDVDKLISSCGEPTRAYLSEDGYQVVQYLKHSIWLKFRRGPDGWSWFKAFDDKTLKDIDRVHLQRRLPCVKPMLEHPAAAPIATVATAADSTKASPPNDSSSDWGFVALIGIIVVFIILKRRLPKKLPSGPVKCPYCGSDQVQAGQRGWRLTTGFIGSGKILMTCLRCGKRFKPGRAA
jgi:hypothetical protein